MVHEFQLEVYCKEKKRMRSAFVSDQDLDLVTHRRPPYKRLRPKRAAYSLNSAAVFSIASASVAASTSPTRVCLAVSL
jgi:hypothetical protein